jgi:hypothetical protein
MKIPPDGPKKGDRFARLKFVEDTRDKCLHSRVERRQQYTSNRFYWLYGTDGSYENEDTETGLGPPPGNKLWPHIDQLSSFLYAMDTTRFSVALGAGVPAAEAIQPWVDPTNGYINDHWHSSNTDLVFALGLVLSLVYGSVFLSPRWKKNEIQPKLVLPHNFGVLREDTWELKNQEAFVHCTSVTESQFRNDFGELPRFNKLFEQVNRRGAGQVEAAESGIDRIIMSNQDPLSGGGVGVVDWLAQVSMNYIPRVKEPLIDLYELYVWDDSLNDYRIFTVADPCVPLFDRPLERCGWLKHTEPYIQICPNPDPSYFWGMSEVERLTPLQVYRNKCQAQLDHLEELQAHAPSTASGFPGDLLEIQYALDTPSGFLNQPDPSQFGAGGVRADRIKIEIPETLYKRIDRIDSAFEDMSGLPAITQGKNAPGVRSGGHASELAKLGATRAKKRALIVEDVLESVATTYLKLCKRYDPTRLSAKLKGPQGKEEAERFIADQLPDDLLVKVDGHSSSPIFMDDATAIAFQLLKVKAITRKRLLQLVPNLPMRQQLLNDLETEIEPAEKAAAAAQQQMEQQRMQQKAEGRPGKPNGQYPSEGGPTQQ